MKKCKSLDFLSTWSLLIYMTPKSAFLFSISSPLAGFLSLFIKRLITGRLCSRANKHCKKEREKESKKVTQASQSRGGKRKSGNGYIISPSFSQCVSINYTHTLWNSKETINLNLPTGIEPRLNHHNEMDYSWHTRCSAGKSAHFWNISLSSFHVAFLFHHFPLLKEKKMDD